MKGNKIKNIISNSPLNGRTFFILLILIFIIKQIIIYYSYINIDPILYIVLYFLSDIPVFLIFLFIILINTKINNKKYKITINILLLIISFHYYVDTFVIYFFQSRALIPEILNFIGESGGSRYYFIGIILLLLYIILGIFSFIFVQFLINKNKKYIQYGLLFGVFIYFLTYGILYYRNRDIKFLGNVFTLNSFLYKTDSISYDNYKNLSTETVYEDHLTYENGEGNNLNIILIFAESLSQIDSKRDGGYDNMPLFDLIQSEGITYTNFITNGSQSQSAHISTLLGIIPWTYNTYTGFKYIMEPLPKFFNQQGFDTYFFSSAPLSFLNQKQFLIDIGYKNIIGEEAFINRQKYTFDSAPDGDLYNIALKKIESLTGKFFVGLQTISFHKPYNTPYGNTKEKALKYSDEKLYEFYQGLKNIGYFDSGILVIVDDHRKMDVIDDGEYEKIGSNRYTKSVATVVGSGIKPGIINEQLIQHTDFYNSLKKYIGKGNILLDKHHNNIFNGKSNRDFSITINPGMILNQKKYTILIKGKQVKSFDKLSIENIIDPELYEYLVSFLKFQGINLKIRDLTN